MIILDKSTRSKIFLEILADYNGVCLKNFKRIEQKLENAFLAKFPIFFRISSLKKIIFGILRHR